MGFFGFSVADRRQGCCLEGASCTGMGRGVLLFGFLPDQCHSSRVRGPADPTKDAHWAPGSLPWLCSRHCHLRKWAGKLRGGVSRHRREFSWGVPTPHWKTPHLLCITLSCLLAPASFHPASPREEVKACWEPLRAGMLPLGMTVCCSLSWGQKPQKLGFLHLNSKLLHFCSTQRADGVAEGVRSNPVASRPTAIPGVPASIPSWR